MAIIRSAYTKTVTTSIGASAVFLNEAGYTPAEVAAADRVTIGVTSGALRITWDHPATNNPPSGSSGLKIPTNDYPFFVLEGRTNVNNLQMIGDGGSACTVVFVLETD